MQVDEPEAPAHEPGQASGHPTSPSNLAEKVVGQLMAAAEAELLGKRLPTIDQKSDEADASAAARRRRAKS